MWFTKKKGPPNEPEQDKTPDLSKVNLINPSAAAFQSVRDDAEKSEQSWAARKEAIETHPLRDMRADLRHDVDRVLDQVTPEWNDDGKLDGLSKEEARTVLTAALNMLDTEHSPVFMPEPTTPEQTPTKDAEATASQAEERANERAARIAAMHEADRARNAMERDEGRDMD